MRVINPAITYYKMLADASRLRDWAERMGNDQHKAFTKGLEEVLKAKLPIFTADVSAAPTAKQTKTSKTPLPPFVLGQIARDTGVDRADNPYNDNSAPLSEDWHKWDNGWCMRDDIKSNPTE